MTNDLLEMRTGQYLPTGQLAWVQAATAQTLNGTQHKLTKAALEWLADPYRCLSLPQAELLEQEQAQRLKQYEAACAEVDRHNASVDELYALLQEAQELGQQDTYAELYARVRSQGSRRHYPAPPQPTVVDAQKPFCLATPGLILSPNYILIERKGKQLLLYYPVAEKPIVLPWNELLWAWATQGYSLQPPALVPAQTVVEDTRAGRLSVLAERMRKLI